MLTKRNIFSQTKSSGCFRKLLAYQVCWTKEISLEGAESLIPALDALIERGADLGVEEYVMGMAHEED